MQLRREVGEGVGTGLGLQGFRAQGLQLIAACICSSGFGVRV